MLHVQNKGAAMQQNSDIALVTKTAPIATVTHGGRAKCLQRLVRLDLPVPKTVSLSFEMVHRIASNEGMDVANILSEFSQDDLLCVRPSSESPDWGGPRAVLNVGINDAQYAQFKFSQRWWPLNQIIVGAIIQRTSGCLGFCSNAIGLCILNQLLPMQDERRST